ncbi:PAS domain S-box protein, partial [Pseudomonas syringae pv. actinidiae]|nr:PAS domain S-box protein [Pseudomonas syringae pv. actinidiae]NVL42776.1 PAS domain S-box protein [Pseudomonas syringae pv. actinidiae]
MIDISDREALRLSEGRFASVFAQCPDAMIIASLIDGHIMDANQAFVEHTGLSIEEVIGKTPTELDLWAVPGIGPKVLKQLQTGNIHNLEIPFRRKNGQTFSGLMSAQPFEQGSTPAVLVIVRDITRLKLAQQQLQLSEEKFAKAFHAAPDGLAITRQQDGMLLEVNEGFCRITGYSELHCLEHYTFDLGIWADLSERSKLTEQLEQHGVVHGFRARLCNVNGSIRVCELSSHPLLISGDACLLTISRDITESQLMQEKLHLAATVFESTAEGVLITDTDQRISAVNRAFTEITGYSESEAIGQTPRLLASGQHDSAFYASMWHQLTAEGHWQGEISNRRKNGELYPSWLTVSAVRNKENLLTHFVAVFADISSLKHAQARLDYRAHHDPLTG